MKTYLLGETSDCGKRWTSELTSEWILSNVITVSAFISNCH